MSTSVTIVGDRLVVEPQGLDRLWSLRRRIEVPLAHVAGATFDPGATRGLHQGVRSPGLRLPGKIAGRYRKDGETLFWNTTGSQRVVVVTLRQEEFDRLYLTVDQPREVVRDINNALPPPTA